MMLPNPEQAVVDIVKLSGYCLNPTHRRGRHKARVFAAVLGVTVQDAEVLKEALLDAVLTIEAMPTETTEYGHCLC